MKNEAACLGGFLLLAVGLRKRAESGQTGGIKRKNPSVSAESGQTGEIKGKNPFDSAQSGRTGANQREESLWFC
ncbi:hypothetical protein [Paenibacillus typhae]|uniref:hypothetical protein n=1 Tax=Paenibacillus typhae TaxID=1174501 RepID=UPI001113C5ED|nr:hypothetical protein [Paenibacillus typhae]